MELRPELVGLDGDDGFFKWAALAVVAFLIVTNFQAIRDLLARRV